MIKKIKRFFNTIKYLKFNQIYWRIIYLFPQIISSSKFYPKSILLNLKADFISKKEFTKDFNVFTFLSETHSLNEIGWNNSHISKLWMYNLHYFDFLIQKNLSCGQLELQTKLINNWIDNNPFGQGIGWEPYPTSLRIINWIKWDWSKNKLSEKAKLSLWNQVKWLLNRPEYHLLGNHLFVNSKALIFAVVYFNLEKNSRIFVTANNILKKQLNEQFLIDGGHFELSPMYHSLIIEDMLDLLNISEILPEIFPKKLIKKKYLQSIYWLSLFVYEKGELPHFNDCANGIAPNLKQLQSYASKFFLNNPKKILPKFTFLKDSGFIIFKDKKFHLIADFGKIGPDYLPGHGHADTLSFELSVYGNRLIVNSGTSVYGNSNERKRQRGTLAHSTVEIDGQNSSDVWSGFRVASRAKVFDTVVNNQLNSKNKLHFEASHDGYKKLNNQPIHHRTFIFENSIWTISDQISGKKNHVISRFYLHPDINVSKNNFGFVLSNISQKLALLKFSSGSSVELISSTYHDKFGVSKKNFCFEIKDISPCINSLKIELL